MPAILEVKDLVKKYGGFTAVKGISFEIREGEIFSLLGPNDAGKTTTISILSTLYAPTSGDAVISEWTLGFQGAYGSAQPDWGSAPGAGTLR